MIDWAKPIQTKGGKRLTLLTTARPVDANKVVVMDEYGSLITSTIDGAYCVGGEQHIVNVPEKKFLYLNVCDPLVGSCAHPDRASAVSSTQNDHLKARVRIEYYEGQNDE